MNNLLDSMKKLFLDQMTSHSLHVCICIMNSVRFFENTKKRQFFGIFGFFFCFIGENIFIYAFLFSLFHYLLCQHSCPPPDVYVLFFCAFHVCCSNSFIYCNVSLILPLNFFSMLNCIYSNIL